jgi:2,4-dienoyl-CoA reductase-like NADH-dependent reductase (Old Yellow Enzyme family)
MPADPAPLFEPLEIRGQALRNRIVMPPMVQLRPLTSPEGIDWYRERAAGGVGLVIVEATAVNRFGTELTAATLRPLVDAVHAEGARIAIQLFPVTFDFPRVEPLPTPMDVTVDDIHRIVDDFRRAAGICAEAGFDGVEPHGAHDYLINQFFSPVQNTRTDEYGGTQEARERFALEIVAAVLPAVRQSGMWLLYRHTPVGQGYDLDDSVAFMRRLVAAGVDVLDISPASDQAPGDRAAPFVQLGVPVIAVNELDEVDRALEALVEGRAQLIAVGRGLLADPEWANRVRQGLFEDIQACERCGGCHGHLRRGEVVACVQWAA